MLTSHASGAAPGPPRARWRRTDLALERGLRVALFEAGRTDTEAPVVVFVHGMGHWTQAAWDFLAAHLEETHRLVAFDLPGFGDSAKPEATYALDYFAMALREVVERCRLDRFALVGHSLGGLIAAKYASLHPADVRLLGLIAPAGFLRTPKLALRIAGSRPVSWLFRRIRPSRRFVRRTFTSAVHDASSVPEDYHAHAYALSQDTAMTGAFVRVYAGAMRELLRMDALHGELRRYTGPVSIVWGKQDRFVPIRALPATRRVYPQADVLEIERCGHCPSIEYPELVARRLLACGA